MSAVQLIDEGAVLWSAPQSERADRPLLVLLHGYGSHEGDLFGLAPHLPLDPVIAAVRAPLRAGPGYSWYPLENVSHEERAAGADAAARGLLQWLDGTSATSVGLLGFSQGGAMSIQLLRHAPERFAFAVSLAGFVVPGQAPADDRLAQLAPPVFWGRGTHDEVIPSSFIEATQRWLPHHSTLTTRIYEGLGHSVSEPELADVLAFLRARYA